MSHNDTTTMPAATFALSESSPAAQVARMQMKIEAGSAASTEKGRWQHFVNGYVQTNYNMGLVVDSYNPGDRIADAGLHGTIQDFGPDLLQQLNESDQPLELLGCAIHDLEGYLQDLREVQEAFRKINATLASEEGAA